MRKYIKSIDCYLSKVDSHHCYTDTLDTVLPYRNHTVANFKVDKQICFVDVLTTAGIHA